MRYLKLDQGWSSLILLSLMVLSVVWAIEAPGWVPGLDMITWIALAGIVFGFALSQINVSNLPLHSVGSLVGVMVITILAASLTGQETWPARFIELYSRFAAWVQVTINGGIGTDDLLFLGLMAGIAWALGYCGAWTVFRHGKAWWSVVTSGVVLLVDASYVHNLSIYLVGYLVGALLLAARLNYAKREKHWRQRGVDYTAALGWWTLPVSALVVLVVMGFAWILPPVNASDSVFWAVNVPNGPWRQIESTFNRVFAGFGFPGGGGKIGYTQTLALKGSVRLGNDRIMEITTAEPHYWRGMVYQEYTGRGWEAADIPLYEVPADEERLTGGGEYLFRHDVYYSVKIINPRGSALFVPADPKMLSIPTIAELDLTTAGLSPVPPGILFSSDDDYFFEPRSVNSLHAFTALTAGSEYTGVSSVSTADVTSLRHAGGDYPSWVTSRYLALPSSFPSRVVELAHKITSDESNAYDKSSAIESYLHQYIYSLDLPAPPSNQDAVDYFLFDARKGYCDYFASAMAVLCRSVGVPARVVSGYAPGNYDYDRNCYIITDAQAHTWVEVYFPGLGWIEFEPTSSRSLPTRPFTAEQGQDNTSVGMATDVDVPAARDNLERQRQNSATILESKSPSSWEAVENALPVISVVLLTLAIIYGLGIFLWRSGLGGLPFSQSIYARMCRLSHWLGMRPMPSETPHEFAQKLGRLVPSAEDSVQTITDSYVQSVFGQRLPEVEQRQELTAAWKRIRKDLLKMRLLSGIRARWGK